VDVDRHDKPLNRYPKVTCQTCEGVDETAVPVPLLVSPWVSRSKQEIFHACMGLTVVRKRVLDLLLQAIDGQIQYGPARAGSKAGAGEKLFWVRPKRFTGRSSLGIEGPKCPACKRPVQCWMNHDVQGLFLEEYGLPRTDIALVPSWYGHRIPSATHIYDTVVSGGLFAYLYNQRVQGLWWPEDGGYVSIKRGQSPIEDKRRFDIFPPKEDRVFKRKWSMGL
jgi:hypothetical protein